MLVVFTWCVLLCLCPSALVRSPKNSSHRWQKKPITGIKSPEPAATGWTLVSHTNLLHGRRFCVTLEYLRAWAIPPAPLPGTPSSSSGSVSPSAPSPSHHSANSHNNSTLAGEPYSYYYCLLNVFVGSLPRLCDQCLCVNGCFQIGYSDCHQTSALHKYRELLYTLCFNHTDETDLTFIPLLLYCSCY